MRARRSAKSNADSNPNYVIGPNRQPQIPCVKIGPFKLFGPFVELSFARELGFVFDCFATQLERVRNFLKAGTLVRPT